MAYNTYNTYNPNSGAGAYNSFTNPPSNISNDNIRRNYHLGSKIAELNPEETPFFTFLTKFGKEGTTDPVFKSMEIRHQWQRRNFNIVSTTYNAGGVGGNYTIVASAPYDRRGKVLKGTTAPCYFLLPGQVIAFSAVHSTTGAGIVSARILSITNHTTSGSTRTTFVVEALNHVSETGTNTAIASSAGNVLSVNTANTNAQVIGSAYAEATTAPDGWADYMSQSEGYCQIFKTSNDIMSGTAMSTEFRGKGDEFMRIWAEKLKEHKMDINTACMFGIGRIAQTSGQPDADSSADGRSLRYTWGVLPYIQLFGQTQAFTYASSSYDDFVDWMRVFFAPEDGNSGTKICLASRKVVAWFNKMGNGNSFLGNTLLTDAIKMDVKDIPNTFGFTMIEVKTIFGRILMIAEPLLRGLWEDYAILLDPKNIAYRYLNGNGRSRDTFIKPNIQDNDMDGRKDLIITEAGMEILLPETHCVLKFS